MAKTTMSELIRAELKKKGDIIDVSTLTKAELYTEFDNSHHGYLMPRFTVWGSKYVYFPVIHDGCGRIGSVPRNPCTIKTDHMGG